MAKCCIGRGLASDGKGSQTIVGAFLIPGGIMGIIRILLIPTALLVSRTSEKPS